MADTQHTNETWKPVLGYEDLYEVSDLGRVRSLDRSFVNARGENRTYSGKVLQSSVGNRYHQVTLSMSGTRRSHHVHRLVLEAFRGPCTEDQVARHLNDDPSDNRLENLAWGSHSENGFDAVRNGRNHYANRSACIRGHEYTPENTVIREREGRTIRVCQECARETNRKTQLRIRERKRVA